MRRHAGWQHFVGLAGREIAAGVCELGRRSSARRSCTTRGGERVSVQAPIASTSAMPMASVIVTLLIAPALSVARSLIPTRGTMRSSTATPCGGQTRSRACAPAPRGRLGPPEMSPTRHARRDACSVAGIAARRRSARRGSPASSSRAQLHGVEAVRLGCDRVDRDRLAARSRLSVRRWTPWR